MCGLEATQIFTWPIHVKLGFMNTLTSMYTLSLRYETLNVDTRKVWWFRDTVCGSDVKKATEIVTLPIHVKLGFMHTLFDMYTHNTIFLGYETLEYERRHQNKGTVIKFGGL